MFVHSLAAIALALVAPATAAYPLPGKVTGNTFAHDPTVVKRPDGSYLLAFTADGVGLSTSTDRTAWKSAGSAFPNGASWTTSYTGGAKNLWAPDLSYRNGQYYMYYSASSFGSSKSAIFLATSATGNSGSWTNQGLIVETNSSSNYNAIDPNLFVDNDGRWYLSFGSFWSGIKLIELDPSTGKRKGTSMTAIASRNGGAIEAPVIVKRGNYYYLWVSFDLCCKGTASTYRIMVGRSTSVTGPYVDKKGVDMNAGGATEMLAGQGNVHGPGHQAILADSDADALFYHYYGANGAAALGINLIKYVDGWPVVY